MSLPTAPRGCRRRSTADGTTRFGHCLATAASGSRLFAYPAGPWAFTVLCKGRTFACSARRKPPLLCSLPIFEPFPFHFAIPRNVSLYFLAGQLEVVPIPPISSLALAYLASRHLP